MMKKCRLIALVMAVCMLLGLLAGCDGPSGQSQPTELQQTTEATEATLPPLEGTMELSTAEDLLAMAGNPVKTYVLKQDIDMAGKEWTGIAGFRSTFEGNGHTISNLIITAAEGSADLGFFADITAEGEVKDLNLANVTIDASKSSAKNIGTIAGTNLGKVTNCTATGIITDTREEAMSVGALVGTAAAGATVTGGTSVSVTDDAGVYTTEGLAADVKLFVADHENVKRGLVGSAASGSTVSGLWRDRFYSSERNSDIIKERQQKAVDYMYTMGTVAWTVPETVTFNASSPNSVHNQVFEPGVVYTGIPYAHPNGNLQRFMYCMDENNQLADWAMEAFGDMQTTTHTGLGFASYMGNDCDGAFDWAWMQITPADPYKGGAIPSTTNYLLPVANVQRQFGIFPVGQMKGDRFDGTDAAYKVMNTSFSEDIVRLNGEDVILEAYAMARKADGMVYRTTSGHARLLAEDPVVIRNADGSIDPMQSYMLIHEQGDGLYQRKYLDAKSSWRIHFRYTFDVLLHGSSKEDSTEQKLEGGSGVAYLPITIRTLREDTVYEPTVMVSTTEGKGGLTHPERGGYSSNYRILSSQVIIKDATGNVVRDKVFFTTGREINNKASLALLHAGVTEGLEPGDYTFSVIATLSDGSVHTVVENLAYQQI